MTHTRIPRFLRRTLTAGLMLAGLGGLILGTTGAASASPLHLRAEFFTVQITNYGSHVDAIGGVRGVGTDTSVTPTFDVFSLHHPTGTVDVRHTAVNEPKAWQINPYTCDGFAFTYGSWQFVGGTGADWGAFGFGHFDATVFEQFPMHHGHCETFKEPLRLDVSVTAFGQAVR